MGMAVVAAWVGGPMISDSMVAQVAYYIYMTGEYNVNHYM